MALQNGGKTLLVFDTGTKTYYRRGGRKGLSKKSVMHSGSKGFGLALDDAISRRSGPVPVVISHVDGDHIGGLLAWTKDILTRAKGMTLGEARRLAMSEIKEVWCNVPSQDLALSQMAGLLTLSGKGQHDDHARSPDPNSISCWDTLPSIMHSAPQQLTAAETMGVLRAYQQLAQGVGGRPPKPDDGVFSGKKILKKLARLRLTHWLAQAFPEQNPTLSALSGLHIRLALSPEHTTEGANPSSVCMSIDHIDGNLSRVLLQCNLGSNNEPGCRCCCRCVSGASIPPEVTTVLEKRGDAPERPGMMIDVTNEELCPGDLQELYERVVEQFAQAGTPLEAANAALSLAAEFSEATPEIGEKVTMARIVLGLMPLDGIEDRLTVFRMLEILGIPVKGSSIDNHVGLANNEPPNLAGLDYVVLSPGKTELDHLAAVWHKYEERLVVPKPTFAASFFAALAAPSSMRWCPDRSVSNMSSLSLWFPALTKRGSLLLTGDGRHEAILRELEKHVTSATTEKSGHVFQIPHHGSAHNTRADFASEQLPCVVLCPGRRIKEAFVSGGRPELIAEDGKPSPRKQVTLFHEAGAKKVTVVRQAIDSAKSYDIRL